MDKQELDEIRKGGDFILSDLLDEIDRLQTELETEKELHHRFEKLALKNAMEYDEAVFKLEKKPKVDISK